MVMMNWKKDAAGRLVAEWKSGTEKTPSEVGRSHKTTKTHFQMYLPAKAHLRKTAH
jgi:hypothetical protein